MDPTAPTNSPHDATRVARVHPPDWQNPTPADKYHVVVIGAGAGGLVTAAGAAGLGAKVALVERQWLGGDCLNVGCVPSKGLIRAARSAAEVRRAGDFGVEVAGAVRVDFARAAERMREIRARISAVDAAARFRDEFGIDVFLGEARFAADGRVHVGDAVLRYHRAVIAAGARAAVPPVPGLREAAPLTNETVFDLEALPPRLLVLGGGPIGCELAQTFQRFGSHVTVVEVAERPLIHDEPEAAAAVTAALDRDGVDLRLSTALAEVRRDGAARVAVLERDGRREELIVDEILVAVGRAPNGAELGLEHVGVAFDPRHGVLVDARLRTANRRIYAVGDVAMAAKFTHAADAAARLVIQNALFGGRKRVDDLRIPWVTYTDPEVAHVGLTAAGAAERGIAVDRYHVPFADLDRALLDGEEDGFALVLTPRGKDRILGATMVAPHAGEMIGEVVALMQAGKGLGFLSGVIHPYPTQAEAWRKAADAYNRTRLSPGVARLLRAWLSLWA